MESVEIWRRMPPILSKVIGVRPLLDGLVGQQEYTGADRDETPATSQLRTLGWRTSELGGIDECCPLLGEIAMVTHRPAEETARLGDEIYEREIKQQIEFEHRGAVVAIDVDSGSWAVGDNVIDARDRLRAQRPDAIDVWLLRVGDRALHHFGGRPLRRVE